MKKTLLTLALAFPFGWQANANAQVAPAIPRDAKIEAQVEKTLSKMSLDEKVGQMCELDINSFGRRDAQGKFVIDEAKLDEIIRVYKVATIIRTCHCKCSSFKFNCIIYFICNKLTFN